MSISIQKANFWKRFSAWMVDVVLTIVLGMVFALATSSIVKYDSYYEKYTAIVAEYEENFGVTLSNEEYEQLSQEQKADYDERKTEMQTALSQNEEAMRLASTISTLLATIACISLFLSMTVVYFIIPLLFKHGRTLGKKVFGLAVMRTSCVKLTAPILFVRSIIGLFAMETMAVLLLCTMGVVGVIAAIGVQILQIFVMFKTRTNSSIHDLLADTAVVDYASQQIFDSQEELQAALKQAEEDAAAKQENL